MPRALRTVVVAGDWRFLRGLSRLLSTQRALKLCGFAQDAETGAAMARSVRAELLLVDSRVRGVAAAAWPPGLRRILLAEHGASASARIEGAEECLAASRLASELPAALARLFR
jgi:hypothetical protein